MDICRSLIFEALTRFRRGNGSTSVRDNHDRSESAHWVENFVCAQIASEKYLYFGFLSRTGRITHVAACCSIVQRREISGKQVSKDKRKNYCVGTRTASPLRANKRAPKPSCRIAA